MKTNGSFWLCSILLVAVGLCFAERQRAGEAKKTKPPAGFRAVFNGRNLSGWAASPKYWKVEDGCLTGRTDGKLKYNRFAIWRGGKLKNFELRVQVRVSPKGNSGIQYRGTERPDLGKWVVTGYQCDVVARRADYDGMLYEERGRRILAHTGEKVIVDPKGQPWVVGKFRVKKFKPGKWHEYRVLVRGNHHQHWIDGHQTVDVIDLDENGRKLEGVLAVQVHVGPAMKIQYRNFFLKDLPGNLPIINAKQAKIPAGARKVVPQGKKRPKRKPLENPLAHWPHWRGPLENGRAVKADPPLKWNEKTNIKWKVKIPGKGSCTPIVWGNRVFITTAVDTQRRAKPGDIPKLDKRFPVRTTPPTTYHQFMVLCLNRATGKTLWKRTAAEAVPHEGIHPSHSYAAGSPVTDGKHLYVSFGSQGVYCYDLAGNLKWKKKLGRMRTRYAWGEASTPALHKNRLVVCWDHEGQSYIFTLDAKSGTIVWKKKRDERTSWATPIIVHHRGKTQVIVSGTSRVRSYDLQSGKVNWQVGPLTVNAIPTPLVNKDVVYCMSGYKGYRAYAVPLGAKGDLSGTEKVHWRLDKSTPYIASPLLMGDRLYFTTSLFPLLNCVDVKTGKWIYERQRLPGMVRLYASPVGAGKRIYITDRDGTTMVVEHSDRFKILATNKLAEPIDGSPAMVGKQVFLRSHHSVYCIQNGK